MLMDMYLPKFDIYQGTVAPNCFNSHTNSSCPDIFQKMFCLSDVRSSIKLVRSSIISSRLYVRA